MISPDRIRQLNDAPVQPDRPFVTYWMQQSGRVRYNHALAAAIQCANEIGKSVVVCFGLMDDYPEAAERHYAFLLEGLRDVATELAALEIPFIVRHGQPFDAPLSLLKQSAAIYCDRGYLRHQKRWRDLVADQADCQVIEVETDVVVPVDLVNDKHEFAARTIRPKIHRHWDAFIIPMRMPTPKHKAAVPKIAKQIDISRPEQALATLKIDRSVKASTFYQGGSVEAHRRLDRFLSTKLKGYADARNEPADDATSHLSMHLHFGQISPVDIAVRVRNSSMPDEDKDAFLEELIVRRELSMNFVNFHPHYDCYACLPNWAKQTLAAHAKDPRERIYTKRELENAQTDDPYWNAAQRELTRTGFMHNYMRMYWGKRILGWMKTPEEAFETALVINNTFQIDGRDANSFANVAWLFGLHDRPWAKRSVFGTVRYMNTAGLRRKFDIDRYVRRIEAL